MSRTLPVQCLVLSSLSERQLIDSHNWDNRKGWIATPCLQRQDTCHQQMSLVYKTNMNINNQPWCILYHLFAFSIHYLTLPTGSYVWLFELASNQHSQEELLLNELHHVIFSWSSTMFTKQNPAAKSEKTMICIVVPRQFGSNSAAGSGKRGCVIVSRFPPLLVVRLKSWNLMLEINIGMAAPLATTMGSPIWHGT